MRRVATAVALVVLGITFAGTTTPAPAGAECIIQTDSGCVQDVRPPSPAGLPQFKSLCEITGACPINP